MSEFYADPAVGGDGSTTTDDNNPTTGLGNGGFWTRLVPMFAQIVNIINYGKTKAAEAAASAAAAVNAPGTSATSTSSMTIGIGAKTLTLAQTGKAFSVGQQVRLASTASPTNWMDGAISAFNAGTGAMTVDVTNIKGSGTIASWTVSLSGAPGISGVLNELKGANIASAATVNLDTATGNFLHITGTTQISAFTLAQGAERTVVFDGVLTVVNGANLLLPNGVNLTTRVGDAMVLRGEGSGVVRCVSYARADGSPVAYVNGHIPRTVVAAAGTTVDCSTGTRHSVSVAATSTLAFTNVPAGEYTCIVEVNHTGGTLFLPSGSGFGNNKPPAFVIGRRHLLAFTTTNQGTNWIVAYLQNIPAA